MIDLIFFYKLVLRNELHVINLVFICRFGKRYELPLLAQSIIMLFAMMALVHLCVHVKRKSEILASKQYKFTGLY